MKIRLLYLIFLVAIGIGCFFSNISDTQDIHMNELFNLSMAQAEDPPEDDEKNSSATEECDDGTSCECDLCIKGKTDCTPTCPCCE